MNKLNDHPKNKGFSLIEAAIVLGIIGLVIGGIWVAASAAQTKFKISETAQGILTSCEKASRVFPVSSADSGGTETLMTSTGIAAGVFPKNWVKSSSTVASPLSDIILTQNGQTTGVYAGFDFGGALTFYIKDMPMQYCAYLLSSLSLGTNKMIGHIVTGTAAPVAAGGPGWARIYEGNVPYTGTVTSLCDPASPLLSVELDCIPR